MTLHGGSRRGVERLLLFVLAPHLTPRPTDNPATRVSLELKLRR
jgi:hypothetical protein